MAEILGVLIVGMVAFFIVDGPAFVIALVLAWRCGQVTGKQEDEE